MFAQATRKPVGTSRSLSHDAGAADAARAQAATIWQEIGMPPTPMARNAAQLNANCRELACG